LEESKPAVASDVPDVSVILPVYNESGHVAQEVDRIFAAFKRGNINGEIVVVDDGSTDGTSEVVDAIDGIRVIHLHINRGSGAARRVGTEAARGEIIVWTDADFTYPNDKIPELVAALEGYDQVVGSRDREAGTHRWLRTPVKWLIRRLAQFLVRTPIPDLNSGFRAFRRDVGSQFLNQLPTGFSCVTTMTMSFLANGYSVRYMPIEYAERAGRSKFHWWRDTSRYLMQVVRMVISYEPLRVFLPPGVFLLIVALTKGAYDVVEKDFRFASNTIVVLLMATQIIVLGLVADLIVRVNRPKEMVRGAASLGVDRGVGDRNG